MVLEAEAVAKMAYDSQTAKVPAVIEEPEIHIKAEQKTLEGGKDAKLVDRLIRTDKLNESEQSTLKGVKKALSNKGARTSHKDPWNKKIVVLWVIYELAYARDRSKYNTPKNQISVRFFNTDVCSQIAYTNLEGVTKKKADKNALKEGNKAYNTLKTLKMSRKVRDVIKLIIEGVPLKLLEKRAENASLSFTYPLQRDPNVKKDNAKVVTGLATKMVDRLIKTTKLEDRLVRPNELDEHNVQLQNYKDQGATGEILLEELAAENGPANYTSHHGVDKPLTTTTKHRLEVAPEKVVSEGASVYKEAASIMKPRAVTDAGNFVTCTEYCHMFDAAKCAVMRSSRAPRGEQD